MVIADLKLGVVSRWAAENVYKVVFIGDSLEVDAKKTEELREKEREIRKKQGKTYDEFMKDWIKRRPPSDALRFYGDWPIPFSKSMS